MHRIAYFHSLVLLAFLTLFFIYIFFFFTMTTRVRSNNAHGIKINNREKKKFYKKITRRCSSLVRLNEDADKLKRAAQ